MFTPTSNIANPLADFTSVAWNATLRNALPVAGCTIIGAGNGTYAVPVDITGELDEQDFQSLAVRDLQRGVATGLPSGEAVARLVGEEPLSRDDDRRA